jgi:hypothetical protein
MCTARTSFLFALSTNASNRVGIGCDFVVVFALSANAVALNAT